MIESSRNSGSGERRKETDKSSEMRLESEGSLDLLNFDSVEQLRSISFNSSREFKSGFVQDNPDVAAAVNDFKKDLKDDQAPDIVEIDDDV